MTPMTTGPLIVNLRPARALRTSQRKNAIADALTRAVVSFGKRFDARRGVTARLSGSAKTR